MDYFPNSALKVGMVENQKKAEGAARKTQIERTESFNRAALQRQEDMISLLQRQLDEARITAEAAKKEGVRAKRLNILMLILTVISTVAAVISTVIAAMK